MAKNDLGGRGTTDFSRSPVSRYIQLATLFRNRIASGEWPVGSRIPNVDELAGTFEVARGTMREALGLLEQEGLLERLRAKGTFVRKSPTEAVPHRLALDWKSLIAAHEGATIEMLDQRRMHELVAALAVVIEQLAAQILELPRNRRQGFLDAARQHPLLHGCVSFSDQLQERDAGKHAEQTDQSHVAVFHLGDREQRAPPM